LLQALRLLLVVMDSLKMILTNVRVLLSVERETGPKLTVEEGPLEDWDV
jgi:hypothetical protein